MKLTKRALLALAIALAPVAAFATHVPGGSEKIEYDGPANPGASVTGAIGWTDPKDGYDWYCINVTKGKKVSFSAKRTSGDIKLNIGVLQGLAKDGDTVSSLKLVDHTNNSTTPDVTFSFTPTFDGAATVWVSTWLGENGGNYTLLMTGGLTSTACGATSGGGGTPTPVGAITVSVPIDPILMTENQTVTVPFSVSTSGVTDDVNLSVSGLPEDVKVTLDKTTFKNPGSGNGNVTITTSSFTFPATYFVTITGTTAAGDQAGSASFQVILDCQPPIILGINHPKNARISRGSSASLTVVAQGSGPLLYQWYQGYTGVTTSPVPGATGPSLKTSAVNDTTQYWVRVTNACGSVDSQTATITTQ